MVNHPNRSCAAAHKSLFISRCAIATFGDLAADYKAARIEQDGAKMVIIDGLGEYRFGGLWIALRISDGPATQALLEQHGERV